MATVLGAVIATVPVVGFSGQALADEGMMPEPAIQSQQPTQAQPQANEGTVAAQADPEPSETFTVTTAVSPNDAGTAESSKTTNVTKDATVELTAKPRLGYKFTGWTVTGGASLADAKSLVTSFKMPAADVTATANFEKVGTVKVTFDGNGGTTDKGEKTVTQEVTKKTSVELTPTSFKRAGYKLVGWSLSKDSGGSNLLKDSVVSLLESQTEKDVTIYAQWAQAHTVTLTDDGNGTATADPAEQVKDEKVNLKATPKNGYVFDAWQVVKGGVTIENDEFVMGDEDVEIRATFVEMPKSRSATATTTSASTASSSVRDSKPEMGTGVRGFVSRSAEPTFTISQKVPSDATYMMIWTDLDPALYFTSSAEDVVVAANGGEITSGAKVSIDGQRLTVLIDDENLMTSLRGKEVTVKYKVKVDDDVNLDPYTSGGIASIPYTCTTAFRGASERTVSSVTEYLKIRTSQSTQSGSSSSKTSSTGTTTRTLAATGDPMSVAATVAALVTGTGFVFAGRRSRRR